MNRVSRTFSLAAAASLVALSMAGPAEARRWGHRHHDNDVGDVIAGVAIVGGIAAIASAITQGNRERQDAAVDTCAEEAEERGEGRVTDIGPVSKKKGYYTVEGMIDRAEGPDDGAYDAAAGQAGFVCTVRNGRIYHFRMSGTEA